MKATQKIRLSISGVSIDTCAKNIRKGLCKDESANKAAKMCLNSFEKLIANDFTVGISGFWNGHRVSINFI